MTFTNICVAIVIGIIVIIVTLLCGSITAWTTSRKNAHDDVDIFADAWVISSIGFAVCLTILLYQNGLI